MTEKQVIPNQHETRLEIIKQSFFLLMHPNIHALCTIMGLLQKNYSVAIT